MPARGVSSGTPGIGRSSGTYGLFWGAGEPGAVAGTLVALVAAILSREGFRVPTGTTRLFAVRVRDLDLPEHLVTEIAPLLAMLEPLKEQIDDVDAQLVEMAQRDDRVKRLMAMPQIGAVTGVVVRGDAG